MVALFFLTSLLCSLPIAIITAQEEGCINTYQELNDFLRSNNTMNLLKYFYPPRQAEPHYIKVIYNISGTDISTYYWTDTALLAVINFDLLRALTFRIADFEDEESDLHLVIPPFCNTDDETEQITILTTWVSIYNLYYNDVFISL